MSDLKKARIMQRSFVVLGLATALLGSCTSDITEDVAKVNGRTELSVILEGTRTHMGDKDETSGSYKVYWSEGDCININGMQSNTLSGVEEGTGSAPERVLLCMPHSMSMPS